jgi:selenocysteine lyase/cysteine desulfurase
VYANHASIGPLPRATVAAVVAATERQAAEGIGAIAPLFEEVDRTRASAAALLGADAADVALLGSTSAGVTAVAQGTPWRRSDRIVLFRGEFPTNTTPWQVVAREEGLEIVWLDIADLADDDGMTRIEAALAPGARMVAVSAVQFRTGLRAPLTALAERAHAAGAELFVDAIQGLGCCPLDLASADHVVAGGQKWLMAPMGTALAWSRREHWERMRPRLASWLSHVDPLPFLFGDPGLLGYDRALQKGPALLEGGGPNLAGLAGLGESLRLQLAVGAETTLAHAQAWHDAVEPGLVALGFTSLRSPDPHRRSCILSLTPPDGVHVGELVAALAERGVSAASPDATFRLSPSWPNSLDEASVLVDAVRDAL